MRLASLRHTMLLAACAAVLAIAAAMPNARAQEEEEEELTIDQKILHGILSGIGLQRDKPPIEFRERSPLVVPPGRDLPPPETESTVAKNPAWPVDAGEKRRKDALGAQRRKNYDSAIDDGRVLTADEMARGRGTPRQPDGSRRTEDVDQTMLKPSEMGNIFSRGIFGKREETATFTSEPPRTSLTQPPTGYRTPSSAQPYGIGQKAATPAPTPEQLKSKYGTNE
jgi:hypothetical protein